MKKKVKLAVIRDEENDPCPFGLPINEGCLQAGDIIDNMAPLSWRDDPEEQAEIRKANMYLLSWKAPGERCKYAAHIFPGKQNKVDCSFGDTAAGVQESGALLGSPFYSRQFSGISLDGLYSYPLGYYADYNTSRNVFYGIYSLQGSLDEADNMNVLKKVAEGLFKDKNK